MKCASCGQTLEHGDLFCPACGTKVDSEAVDTSTNTPTANDAAKEGVDEFGRKDEADASNPVKAAMGKIDADFFKTLLQDKKKLAIVGGAIVAAIVVIALIVSLVAGGGVPKKQIEEDFKASSIMTNGVLHSDYVNDSPYELIDFSVEGQEEESGEFFGETFSGRTVTVKGTMRNANFESSFTAQIAYLESGDAWEMLSGVDIITQTTKPLKGVDFIKNNAPTIGANNDNVSVGDFESSFKEENGVYTSSASQTATHEFWFADDIAKNTQNFTFDNEKGWVANGDIEASDLRTEWKLSGKSFSYDGETRTIFGESRGAIDSNITFGDTSEDGNLNADYSLNYVPSKTDDGYGRTYHSVSLEGKLLGKPIHEFGENSFSVELNDRANNATLTCKAANNSLVAGSGTVNTINIDIVTNSPRETRDSTGETTMFEMQRDYTEDV